MATKKSYTITTGDVLTDIRDSTGHFSSATFGKLHIPECRGALDVTYNNLTGDVILHQGWKVANVAGDKREEAIMDALKALFTNMPTPAATH